MRRDTSCRACRGQSAVGGSRGLGARRSVVRGARPGSGCGKGGGGWRRDAESGALARTEQRALCGVEDAATSA